MITSWKRDKLLGEFGEESSNGRKAAIDGVVWDVMEKQNASEGQDLCSKCEYTRSRVA